MCSHLTTGKDRIVDTRREETSLGRTVHRIQDGVVFGQVKG